MPVQIEVTAENLLDAVVRMPKGEFDSLVESARKLRRKLEPAAAVTPAEADLLHRINSIFPSRKRKRYNDLYAKFKNSELEPSERSELDGLIDEFETLNADRLELIGKLAEIRRESIDDVFVSFELSIVDNG
jgi:hypothetical protein